LLAFKQLCNCYVSLHRSEGYGFGLIEAMQLGVPVIATAYSGNMDFCSDATCYLVEYDLIVPQPHEYIFVERDSQWAEPRTQSAVAHMQSVEQQRDQANDRALAAQTNVQNNFSVEAISRRYAERLAAINAILELPPLDESPSAPGPETGLAQRKTVRKARVVQS
jgi:glycosyltransferase involved in cell wall biosynthesis